MNKWEDNSDPVADLRAMEEIIKADNGIRPPRVLTVTVNNIHEATRLCMWAYPTQVKFRIVGD